MLTEVLSHFLGLVTDSTSTAKCYRCALDRWTFLGLLIGMLSLGLTLVWCFFVFFVNKQPVYIRAWGAQTNFPLEKGEGVVQYYAAQ